HLDRDKIRKPRRVNSTNAGKGDLIDYDNGSLHDRNDSAVSSIDASLRPYLGFGSCGLNASSPALRQQLLTQHANIPRRANLPTSPTVYYTWSQTSVSPSVRYHQHHQQSTRWKQSQSLVAKDPTSRADSYDRSLKESQCSLDQLAAQNEPKLVAMPFGDRASEHPLEAENPQDMPRRCTDSSTHQRQEASKDNFPRTETLEDQNARKKSSHSVIHDNFQASGAAESQARLHSVPTFAGSESLATVLDTLLKLRTTRSAPSIDHDQPAKVSLPKRSCKRNDLQYIESVDKDNAGSDTARPIPEATRSSGTDLGPNPMTEPTQAPVPPEVDLEAPFAQSRSNKGTHSRPNVGSRANRCVLGAQKNDFLGIDDYSYSINCNPLPRSLFERQEQQDVYPPIEISNTSDDQPLFRAQDLPNPDFGADTSDHAGDHGMSGFTDYHGRFHFYPSEAEFQDQEHCSSVDAPVANSYREHSLPMLNLFDDEAEPNRRNEKEPWIMHEDELFRRRENASLNLPLGVAHSNRSTSCFSGRGDFLQSKPNFLPLLSTTMSRLGTHRRDHQVMEPSRLLHVRDPAHSEDDKFAKFWKPNKLY
ncbi:MAG: hypothetical protein Q9190_006226, partial [Brigantiaea leucoxantha]